MKNLLLVIVGLLLPLGLMAQTLNGYVYEEGTTTAIVNASVYYNGSTTGTVTNTEGFFYLQPKSGQVPLVISCVGYYSTEVTNYKPGDPLKVYLKPKQQELQQVTVKFDGMSRAEKVRIFTREFIGTSKYAKSCTILNIDDVDLYYSLKTKTLSAESSKPIRIQNKMLGYGLSYYLDRFRFSPQGVQYAGNFIFREIPVLAQDKNVKRNREAVYEGSRMQLIRMLWERNVNNSTFRLYNNKYQAITADSVVIDSAQEKYLHLTERLWIAQEGEKGLLGSWITPTTKTSFINKEGYYGLGMRWGGNLTKQRIGDMLPFEYQSSKAVKQQQELTTNDKQINKVFGQEADTGVQSKTNTLSPEEQQLAQFKTIALGNNYLGTDASVRKWTEPIYYKVYGTTTMANYDATLNGYIDKFFARLATLTGLSIKPATDSARNFSIILGNVDDFKDKISPDAYAYFNANPKSNGYYTYNEAGITSMVQRVFMEDLTLQLVWLQVRSQMLSGLGFTGNFKGVRHSLFFFEPYFWTPDKPMRPLDEKIIKTLYLPAIKFSMQAVELDEVLKGKMNAAK